MLNINAQIFKKIFSHVGVNTFFLAACSWPTIVYAQTLPLCTQLKTITAATSTQYVGLRGSFDSIMDAYRGTVVVGELNECYKHSYGNYAEYYCLQRLPDDTELAHRLFETLAASVKACFDQDVKPMKPAISGSRVSFLNIIEGNSISVCYLRNVPKYKNRKPRYTLKLDYSIFDLNENH